MFNNKFRVLLHDASGHFTYHHEIHPDCTLLLNITEKGVPINSLNKLTCL